jgi:DNA polymerase bacteriophage-type
VDVNLDTAIDAVLRRDIEQLQKLAKTACVGVAEVLGSLVRCCVIPPRGRLLAAVDYRSVEARALLWLAGDDEGLDVFRRGECPYRAMAAALYRIDVDVITKPQRQLGKALVLGCGYQMGSVRFKAYAEGCGINWSAVPVTPEQAVEAWRDAHPSVAGWRTGKIYEGNVLREGGFWRELEATAISVASGGSPIQVGRALWSRGGRDLVCTLPGGRRMVYRDARVEDLPTRWGGTKRTLTYGHRDGRVTTYGGKLAENVTQAVCRDLLADALVRLERQGKLPVLHVHDEAVCEVTAEDELPVIESIMRTAPTWAAGLPIDVEGYIARCYKK